MDEPLSTVNNRPRICAYRLAGALRCIDGRWKLPILAHLLARGLLRFSDLERAIPEASQKMLTQHLRELERDAIVTRSAYLETPPRVEYGLTDLGRSLMPVFVALGEWADARDFEPKSSSRELVQPRAISE